MSEHGVNVPPGLPAFTLEQVKSAAEKMASADGEVLPPSSRMSSTQFDTWNCVGASRLGLHRTKQPHQSEQGTLRPPV